MRAENALNSHGQVALGSLPAQSLQASIRAEDGQTGRPKAKAPPVREGIVGNVFTAFPVVPKGGPLQVTNSVVVQPVPKLKACTLCKIRSPVTPFPKHF